MRLLRKIKHIDPAEESKKLERASRAEALLRDDTFREALENIESAYMHSWRQSALPDYELRERCHIALCLLDDIKSQLLNFVRDGVVAQERLEKSLRQ